MAEQKVPAAHYLKDQLWTGNQVLVAVLGICSALGVTNRVSVSLTMGLSVSFCHRLFLIVCLSVAQNHARQRPHDHPARHHLRFCDHHRPISAGLFF